MPMKSWNTPDVGCACSSNVDPMGAGEQSFGNVQGNLAYDGLTLMGGGRTTNAVRLTSDIDQKSEQLLELGYRYSSLLLGNGVWLRVNLASPGRSPEFVVESNRFSPDILVVHSHRQRTPSTQWLSLQSLAQGRVQSSEGVNIRLTELVRSEAVPADRFAAMKSLLAVYTPHTLGVDSSVSDCSDWRKAYLAMKVAVACTVSYSLILACISGTGGLGLLPCLSGIGTATTACLDAIRALKDCYDV